MAFNDLIDTISKAWNYLAHPYHLYDISLERVIYDTQKSEEVAHFVIKNFRTLRKLPVRKALKDRQLAIENELSRVSQKSVFSPAAGA